MQSLLSRCAQLLFWQFKLFLNCRDRRQTELPRTAIISGYESSKNAITRPSRGKCAKNFSAYKKNRIEPLMKRTKRVDLETVSDELEKTCFGLTGIPSFFVSFVDDRIGSSNSPRESSASTDQFRTERHDYYNTGTSSFFDSLVDDRIGSSNLHEKTSVTLISHHVKCATETTSRCVKKDTEIARIISTHTVTQTEFFDARMEVTRRSHVDEENFKVQIESLDGQRTKTPLSARKNPPTRVTTFTNVWTIMAVSNIER